MSTSIGSPRPRPRVVLGSTLLMAVVLALLLASCEPGQRRSGPLQQGQAGEPRPTPSSAGSVAAIPAGRSSQTLTVGGVERTVNLYRPVGLVEPAPLVVMLHGGYGNGIQAETSYHWDRVADSGRFLVAFPDGTNHSWNAGGQCCGPAAASGVDDVAFLSEMVTALRGQIAVDPRRVFVAGISNGGAMAYRMACETDLFAGVGAVSTTMLVDCPDPAQASVLHIHGVQDTAIRYDGAPGEPYSRRNAGIDGPPVPEVHAAWRSHDDCSAPQVTVAGVLTTSAARCPAGRAVELITIDGAGHQWPGGDPNTLAQRLGAATPSTALDATARIWDFFAAHPAPAG